MLTRGVVALIFGYLAGSAWGQTSLALASGSAAQAGTVYLNLSLNAVTTPAALQWTFAYPQSSVLSFSAAPGSALTAAGKTLACQPALGTLNCVASGPNALPISSGVVAVVSITLGSAVTGGFNIGLSNALAVSPDGAPIGMTGLGGTVSVLSSLTPTLPPPVISTPTGSPTSTFAPIRVNAGGEPYTDTAGNLWNGDA